jgi:hypothetical protein
MEGDFPLEPVRIKLSSKEFAAPYGKHWKWIGDIVQPKLCLMKRIL